MRKLLLSLVLISTLLFTYNIVNGYEIINCSSNEQINVNNICNQTQNSLGCGLRDQRNAKCSDYSSQEIESYCGSKYTIAKNMGLSDSLANNAKYGCIGVFDQYESWEETSTTSTNTTTTIPDFGDFTANRSCSQEYGAHVYKLSDGRCSCKDGYYRDSNKTFNQCTHKDIFCEDNFGVNSEYKGKDTNGDWLCGCKEGYYNNGGKCELTSSSCKNQYGNNIHNEIKNDGTTQCICDNGYYWDDINETCEDHYLSCKDKYGDNIKSVVDDKLSYFCECEKGYVFSENKTECIKNNNLIIKETEEELDGAVTWMHSNGLTKFDEPTSFMSENGLRRDEATKFFVKYAKEIMGIEPDTSNISCNFSDLGQARPDLKDLIKESCQLGLFKGHNGKFMPTQKLTNAQAITVFIRMTDGKKDETGSHFANEYYTIAKNMGLLDNMNLNSKSNFDSFTTRGEVGRMLFRGKDE